MEKVPQKSLLHLFDDDERLLAELRRWRMGNPATGYAKWEIRETRRRARLRRILLCSAVFLLLVIIISARVLHPVLSSLPKHPLVSDLPSIPPGRNTATLTLTDGQEIQLDNTGNGKLAIQNKTTLVKNAGSLAYTSSSGTRGAVAYNILRTPKAGQFQLLLPDGSQVWLNNVSQLRYPVPFTGKNRTVELMGEAYFEITKDNKRPFIVKTGDLSVEVLGTSFNVSAYDEEGAVRTTLVSGALIVRQGTNSVRLNPDEEAVLPAGGGLEVLRQVPAKEIISWKNGFFYFGRSSLQTVMRQLARWYDVDVVYKGAIPKIEFTGKIDRSLPLKDLLQFLDKSQVHFVLNGRKVTVLP